MSVAIVSGAASGIGRATVDALRAAGHEVIGVDLAPGPESIRWVQGSVTDRATWELALDRARRHDPAGPRCFVACAADLVLKSFLDTPDEDWTRLFDVNVLGVVRGMRALIPPMVQRGGGAIAVVCSVDSLYVEEGLGAYSATKAALLQVVRAAALDHARDGLRINAVCPGSVETALFDRALRSTGVDSEELRAAVRRRTPTGRIMRPEEVAAVLRFLVSDAAAALSGSAITVDGGLTSTYDYDGGDR